ncbi:predicted metalloprotease [Acetobacter aceti NRIC 0242]|uniref:Uncharacterized protein n=1 Tax=Acetobacter aceti NBRC 14818 TaxID=887700 RepID=A0AB33IJG5_ACEAC|nr:hypothetical protein EMQ_2774 [Acetobacter aceti NBRC 14818]GAN58619.1 hypothetical protein Abac_059_018 [Acetobacter aceti NBRC 14818]GBO81500.1 predicted metalloprotease [Acetobacter aceti NRIC 0242]
MEPVSTRLDDERESTNIEDGRGSGGRMPLRIGGIGGVVPILGALYFDVDPRKTARPYRRLHPEAVLLP